MDEGGCPADQQDTSHTTPGKYTCEQCDFCTEHRYRLRIHIHNQHTVLAKTKPLVCKVYGVLTMTSHRDQFLSPKLFLSLYRTRKDEKVFSFVIKCIIKSEAVLLLLAASWLTISLCIAF